jgi:hypothetical protein
VSATSCTSFRQTPPAGVPEGYQWWGESREPAFSDWRDPETGKPGFAAFRDYYFEAHRLPPVGIAAPFPYVGKLHDEAAESFHSFAEGNEKQRAEFRKRGRQLRLQGGQGAAGSAGPGVHGAGFPPARARRWL